MSFFLVQLREFHVFLDKPFPLGFGFADLVAKLALAHLAEQVSLLDDRPDLHGDRHQATR